MEQKTEDNPVSIVNVFLTSCGLIFFALGSYLSLDATSPLLYSGEYFFIFGIALSCLAMISIFLKPDF